jgi:glucokinase
MIAALDIGGTKIAAGLVDRTGRVVAAAQCPTRSEQGFDDGTQRIVRLIRDLQQRTGKRIEGIGIGCTGPVDPRSGTIGNAELLRGWWGAPLAERLAHEFDVSAAMENDADAVALSESIWGSGRNAQCLVCVAIGTGIGAGVVCNGDLYRGADGGHPEIGHMVLEFGAGPKCYCGLTGCWESLASGPALEAWYADGAESVSAAEICRRARAGESRAVRAVERLGRYVGLGLVNVVTMYCPDVVLLSGGVMRDAGLFLDDIRRMVHELATQVPTNRLRIDVADLAGEAGLQGAAAVWLHRFAPKETRF